MQTVQRVTHRWVPVVTAHHMVLRGIDKFQSCVSDMYGPQYSCVASDTHGKSSLHLCQERLFCGTAGVLGATSGHLRSGFWHPPARCPSWCQGWPGRVPAGDTLVASLARLIAASSRMACGFRSNIHTRCHRPTPLQGDFWAPQLRRV